MADHGALRRPGRARRVDEDRRVLGLRSGDLLAEAVGVFLAERAAEPVEVVEEDHLLVGEAVQALAVEDDDLRQSRHAVADRQLLVELLVVLYDQEAAVGIDCRILTRTTSPVGADEACQAKLHRGR